MIWCGGGSGPFIYFPLALMLGVYFRVEAEYFFLVRRRRRRTWCVVKLCQGFLRGVLELNQDWGVEWSNGFLWIWG